MPPDPILALISLVGLFAYVVVGSVVAATVIKKMGHTDHAKALATRQWTGSIPGDRYSHNTHYAGNVWAGFGALVLIWPLIVVTTLVCAIGIGIFFGPAWIASRTGSYVAKIDTKEAA